MSKEIELLNKAIEELKEKDAEIEKLKHLLWDCHYLIRMRRSDDAAELIVKKLNPDAIKRRPTPEKEPEPTDLSEQLRQVAGHAITSGERKLIRMAALVLDRQAEELKQLKGEQNEQSD